MYANSCRFIRFNFEIRAATRDSRGGRTRERRAESVAHTYAAAAGNKTHHRAESSSSSFQRRGGGPKEGAFFSVSNDGISSQLGRRRRRPLSPLHARSRLRRCEHDFEHSDCSPAPMAIYAVSSVSSLTSPAAKSHTFATMFLLLSAFLYEETRLGSARRWVI